MGVIQIFCHKSYQNTDFFRDVESESDNIPEVGVGARVRFENLSGVGVR